MKRFSSNITDEELCDLFREAAEHHYPKLNDSEKQEAWESIANSLLAEPKRRKACILNKWKKRCLALLMLWLLTGGLTFFRIIQLQESNHQYALEAAQARHVLHSPNNTVQIFITAPETQTQKHLPPSTGLAEAGLQQMVEYTSRHAATHDSVKKKKAINNCLNNNYSCEPGTTDANDHTADAVAADAAAAGTAQSIDLCTEDNTDSCAADTARLKPSVRKKRSSLHKWQIGVVTGAEWNKVSDYKHGQANWVNGLTIQYRFARHWSVETGILVAPKRYRAPRLTYQRISSFMELKYVEADCRVIDWPVNIRYDLLIQPNSYCFISAGMSSYLMQKEDYTLNYDARGTMVQEENLSYNENQHLFAIANVSAGYEYHWKRLSLQAAPYVKVPARGIGVGKAKLSSGGLFFSLRYSY